ncbi:MAG: SMP-30/gluconolactonase/LRE family protein [Anaerolineales bacterium]
MDLKAEHLISSQNKLGEGPLWHSEEGAIYWVDILQARVERYHLQSQQKRTFQFDVGITVLGIRARGGFITATTQGFALWDGVSEKLEMLSNPIADKPFTRFNDGAVDRQGRFWAGSMYDGPQTVSPPEGLLFRLDPDGGVHLMESGLTISNGIAWSPDNRKMYLTDSPRRVIYVYDFDPGPGTISNRQVFATVPEEQGYPDGLTIDGQGYLWSARWSGWELVRYTPNGEEDLKVNLPVACPTSCTFGGKDLRDLYITSAWVALSDVERADQPMAGDVFQLKLVHPGLPEPKYLG